MGPDRQGTNIRVGDQALTLRQTEERYKRMYLESIEGIFKHLVKVIVRSFTKDSLMTPIQKSKPNGLTFIAEMHGHNPSYKMVQCIDSKLIHAHTTYPKDHLVCFLPGTLALGAQNGLDPDGSHMQLAVVGCPSDSMHGPIFNFTGSSSNLL